MRARLAPLLFVAALGCDEAPLGKDAGSARDAGPADARALDAAPGDAASAEVDADAGAPDAGPECVDDDACGAGAICLDGACFDCGDGPDCDANGVPDRCDLARETHFDCNLNGVPDRCDLAGASLDCNRSGVPDECEVLTEACTTMGTNGYIEHRAGDMPIILSMPHGGSLEPASIPDRGGTTARDARTIELGEAIADALEARTGRRPHMIICHLHRLKLDANREIVEAAEGNPEAEQAWREYHGYIEAAKAAVTHQHGRGFYVDVHGLAASRTALELGYLLNGTTLLRPDAELGHPAFAHRSSLRRLAEETGRGIEALMRGPGSLGALFEAAGYPSIPSPAQPDPGRDDQGDANRFFSGGYNTFRHGSWLGGPIDGLQLETTWAGVRDTAANRAAFGAATAEVLDRFVTETMGLSTAHPAVVDVAGAEVHALPGAEVQVELHRRGDLDPALDVVLAGAGLTPFTARFAPGQATSTTTLIAPSTPGTYSLAVAPGDYSPGRDATLTLHVPEAAASGVHFVPRRIALSEGASATFEVRLLRSEVAQRVTLQRTSWPWAPNTSLPREVFFEAGQAAVQLGLQVGQDDVATGHGAHGLFSDPQARFSVLALDDDLDPALKAWWPRTSTDRAAPERNWHDLSPDGDRTPAPYCAHDLCIEIEAEHVHVADDFDYTSEAGFSMGFWFAADLDRLKFRYLLSHGRLSADASVNVYLTPSGQLRTALRGPGEGADYDALDVAGDFRDDVWHHYALTVEPGPVATVYLDGVATATAARGNLPFNPTTHLYLGGRYDQTESRVFDGQLADVRVYDRPLTAAEVGALAAP